MKTKFNLLGICFDWRVLVALFAIGIVVTVTMPQLALSVLPLLLLAACPISMILMMSMMNRTDQRPKPNSSHLDLGNLSVDSSFDRDEQLAQLQEHLYYLQTQQDLIARQIRTLEQSEQQRSESSPAENSR